LEKTESNSILNSSINQTQSRKINGTIFILKKKQRGVEIESKKNITKNKKLKKKKTENGTVKERWRNKIKKNK
jgi:hypothetical protein